MKNLRAVCVKCGASKHFAPDACSGCLFTPVSDEDLARSFILSRSFSIEGQIVGRSPAELAKVASTIEKGQPYEFAAGEVADVAHAIRQFRSVKPRHVVGALARTFLPVVLLLLAMWIAIWVLRWR
jgi:hypothetical protein